MFDAQKNCNDLTATGNEVKISTTHWCEPLLGGGFHKFAQKTIENMGAISAQRRSQNSNYHLVN